MDFYVFLNEQIECNEYYTSLLKNVDDKTEELKFVWRIYNGYRVNCNI